jgi:hypothetical protein
MWTSDDTAPLPAPPIDHDRLAEFGPPVFGFVPQARLRERGWSWFAHNGVTLDAQAHYWIADPSGDFGFSDTAAGPLGTELRGYVFTDAVGATDRHDDLVHAALVQHLDYIVRNYQKSRYVPGTPQWVDHGLSRRARIAAAPIGPATLTIVGKAPIAGEFVAAASKAGVSVAATELTRVVDATRVDSADFSATAAVVDGRIVTLVIHSADRAAVDIRLTRRL